MAATPLRQYALDPMGGTYQYAIDGDPTSGAGLAATQGSLAFRIDSAGLGLAYRKVGSAATAWEPVVPSSPSRNFAAASVGPGFAADTYVTNSGILIPQGGLVAGMLFRWFITGSKTAAGTAQAVYTVRLGAAQTTSDTSILALTAVAQTAAVDNGTLLVTAQLRVAGASAVLAGAASWAKTQAGTAGLGGSIDGASSTFDSTGKAGQYVGLSINGGASAAWTLTSVAAELINP